ncbi:DUF4376 domain-containing protein [Martelella mediterranea]|uniref:DUF4376 domain-containing protein n=1 Tax=Martelella mediterranea TaxID=293089 RepID=UPI001E4D885E|nr:DUF4376 domain-containing protein [Martelella mediterranea]MCD1634501.1 DUF4376 domain-containing protein [Martelella mediterranea]
MKIYHFSAATGEFLGSGQADADPLEEGRFLVPANAVTIAPPAAGPHEASVFSDSRWSLVADYRGQTWFDENGNAVEVESLGDPAELGLLAEKPVVSPSPLTVDELAAYARDLSWRIRVAGTDINGVRVRCDDGAIALINGMAMLARQDEARTFNFDTGDGMVSLSAAEAIALATAVGEFVQSTFDRRAAVLAAIADGSVTDTTAIDDAFADLAAAWPTQA